MTVEWTKGAYQDFDEILAYLIREFGVNKAVDFQERLDHNIAVLSEFPFAGKSEFYSSKRNIEYRSLSCRCVSLTVRTVLSQTSHLTVATCIALRSLRVQR